jgi:hypothetical protein
LTFALRAAAKLFGPAGVCRVVDDDRVVPTKVANRGEKRRGGWANDGVGSGQEYADPSGRHVVRRENEEGGHTPGLVPDLVEAQLLQDVEKVAGGPDRAERAFRV